MVQRFEMEARPNSYEVGIHRKLKYSMILRYLQEAAGRHLEGDGLSYEFMREKGIVFLLMKAAVEISRLPLCNEEITIQTWFRGLKGAQFVRDMRILTKTGELLTEAETCWIIADPQTHKILRPSVFTFDMPAIGRDAVNARIHKLPGLKEQLAGAPISKRAVRWSDIDCNGHMNNAVYVDLICDFFPDGLKCGELKSFQVSFLGEAVEGETMDITAACGEDGTAYFEGKTKRHNCFEAAARVR